MGSFVPFQQATRSNAHVSFRFESDLVPTLRISGVCVDSVGVEPQISGRRLSAVWYRTEDHLWVSSRILLEQEEESWPVGPPSGRISRVD